MEHLQKEQKKTKNKTKHTTSGQHPSTSTPWPLRKCQVANETHGVHGKKLDCGEGVRRGGGVWGGVRASLSVFWFRGKVEVEQTGNEGWVEEGGCRGMAASVPGGDSQRPSKTGGGQMPDWLVAPAKVWYLMLLDFHQTSWTFSKASRTHHLWLQIGERNQG